MASVCMRAFCVSSRLNLPKRILLSCAWYLVAQSLSFSPQPRPSGFEISGPRFFELQDFEPVLGSDGPWLTRSQIPAKPPTSLTLDHVLVVRVARDSDTF